MTMVERTVAIARPRPDVWAVLADLAGVVEWNPQVAEAVCPGRAEGVGAERTCRLEPAGTIHEVVSVWEPPHQLWFAVGRHGAIRSAEMGLVLEHADGPEETVVRAVADYHLAFGPLGPVIDHLTFRRSMDRMLSRSLDGLRRHLEQPQRPPQDLTTP